MKDPTSQITPITGTFRSLFLQKALAAILQSLPLFFPCSLCPFSRSLLFLFVFPFYLIIPVGLQLVKVLPAVSFPLACEYSPLQHQGSCEPAQEHLRTHCSLLVNSMLKCLVSFIFVFVCFLLLN